MSDMPLILVAVMFEKNDKFMGGFDVWTVTTAEHFNTAKAVDELDRNLVFLQFNSFRNKKEMIFVMSADDPSAAVLRG